MSQAEYVAKLIKENEANIAKLKSTIQSSDGHVIVTGELGSGKLFFTRQAIKDLGAPDFTVICGHIIEVNHYLNTLEKVKAENGAFLMFEVTPDLSLLQCYFLQYLANVTKQEGVRLILITNERNAALEEIQQTFPSHYNFDC